eukprot:1146588-Pelagomonas_calceolata.AAC.1
MRCTCCWQCCAGVCECLVDEKRQDEVHDKEFILLLKMCNFLCHLKGKFARLFAAWFAQTQFESAADCAATRLAAAQGQGAGEAWALLLPGESTPHHQHAIPMQYKLPMWYNWKLMQRQLAVTLRTPHWVRTHVRSSMLRCWLPSSAHAGFPFLAALAFACLTQSAKRCWVDFTGSSHLAKGWELELGAGRPFSAKRPFQPQN